MEIKGQGILGANIPKIDVGKESAPPSKPQKQAPDAQPAPCDEFERARQPGVFSSAVGGAFGGQAETNAYIGQHGSMSGAGGAAGGQAETNAYVGQLDSAVGISSPQSQTVAHQEERKAAGVGRPDPPK